MFLTMIQVALGGAIGAALRFLTMTFVGVPLATLIVNIVGCFLSGLAFILLSARLSPMLMIGVLGGFTTFSAFSLDALKLYEAGQGGLAALYVGASFLLSLGAVALGAAVARGVFA